MNCHVDIIFVTNRHNLLKEVFQVFKQLVIINIFVNPEKEKAKIAALPEAEQATATQEALEKAKKDVKKLTLAPVAARL